MRLQKYFPIVLIILLAVFLFGQTLLPSRGQMLYGGDIYDAYFYWKNYLKSSILSGTIPFWNPYNFSGTPFISHPNINIFYPLNWLFVILPLNWSFSWYFFFHIIIAGGSMYWMIRHHAGRLGSLAGAITYAFGGFFAARIYSGHLEYVDAASYVPLVFGLTERAFEQFSVKNLIFSGLGMGLLLIVGNELFFLFTLELLFLYIVYSTIRHNKDKIDYVRHSRARLPARQENGNPHNIYEWIIRSSRMMTLRLIKLRNHLVVLLVSCFIGFGIAAAQILPRYEFLSLSLRSQGITYGTAVNGSLTLPGLGLFLNPLYWGSAFPENYSYRGPWPNLFEFTYYIGLMPLILLFAYLLSKFYSKLLRKYNIFPFQTESSSERLLWFFLPVALLFILISLGNQSGFNLHQILWDTLPFYKSIRFPVRHLFVVVFSMSVVSGIIMSGIKNNIIKVILTVIIIFNLLQFDKQFIRMTITPDSTFDPKLVSRLINDKDLYRLLPDYSVVSGVRRDLDFGAAAEYKIATTSDYNSMILWRYYHFIDLANKSAVSSVPYFNVEIPPLNPSSPYIDYLNIKYILSDKQFDLMSGNSNPKYKTIREGNRFILHENTAYLPRFFLVNNKEVYRDEKSLEERLLYNPPDLSKTILLMKNDFVKNTNYDLSCGEKFNGTAQTISYAPNRITITTQANCSSFLSSSEVYYPGWRAQIDDNESKIYLSNFAFRGVFIPKGRHTVTFYYYPLVFYIGGAASLTSGLIAFIIYRYSRKVINLF